MSGECWLKCRDRLTGALDCKTVSSFAGRSKSQARSSNGRLGRGNGSADGSERNGGEGLKEMTVTFVYFISAPQEVQDSHCDGLKKSILITLNAIVLKNISHIYFN